MPIFTMELWRARELAPNGDVGLNDYPIFDPAYRDELNAKIYDHYHNREIGMESISMFRLAVSRRMNEVMPYYNKLYESERLAFDPFVTLSIKNVMNGESDSTANVKSASDTESENDSGSRAVQSNTPQVTLRPNGDYATSAADTTSKALSKGRGNEESDSTARENNKTESETTGYQGMPALLLMQYRDALLNIDMLVIDSLRDCFMLVWDNGDDRFPMNYTALPDI